MGNLRLVLCATSTSRIIAPIRSRCLLMRVAAPNHEEVRRVYLCHVVELTSLADDNGPKTCSEEGEVPSSG